MSYLISAGLLIAGIIHVMPLMGLLGPERLQALYGIPVEDPNLSVLLRHRAVLFGLLGVGLITAAFIQPWHMPALIAGLISVVAYMWLAKTTPHLNAALMRVYTVDVVALVGLIIGLIAHLALKLR